MTTKAEALFNSWIDNPNYGFFWDVHVLEEYTKEDIEVMQFKQLKELLNNIYNYNKSYKTTNRVDHRWVYGYKHVKKELKNLEIKYYELIKNTKLKHDKDCRILVKNVKNVYLLDKGVQKTYYDIFHEAENMVLNDYSNKNTIIYLKLKEFTDSINLKQLVEEKKKELDYIHTLTPLEQAKYYEQKRIEKDPEGEKEKKEQKIIKLEQWREDNPDKLKIAQARAMIKYNDKKQDLTTCETDEELAAKVVKIAIAKALKSVYNAERYKLKQEPKKLKLSNNIIS